MIIRYPIRILVVPPFAVMPLVLPIIGTVFIEPARVERSPILMIVTKSVGIVQMPPIGIAPLVLVVAAPAIAIAMNRFRIGWKRECPVRTSASVSREKIGLVEQNVVKGERKGDRQAGSDSGSIPISFPTTPASVVPL